MLEMALQAVSMPEKREGSSESSGFSIATSIMKRVRVTPVVWGGGGGGGERVSGGDLGEDVEGIEESQLRNSSMRSHCKSSTTILK